MRDERLATNGSWKQWPNRRGWERHKDRLTYYKAEGRPSTVSEGGRWGSSQFCLGMKRGQGFQENSWGRGPSGGKHSSDGPQVVKGITLTQSSGQLPVSPGLAHLGWGPMCGKQNWRTGLWSYQEDTLRPLQGAWLYSVSTGDPLTFFEYRSEQTSVWGTLLGSSG